MPPRISPEALARLPTVTALHVSPDGEHLAFYADWSGRVREGSQESVGRWHPDG